MVKKLYILCVITSVNLAAMKRIGKTELRNRHRHQKVKAASGHAILE